MSHYNNNNNNRMANMLPHGKYVHNFTFFTLEREVIWKGSGKISLTCALDLKKDRRCIDTECYGVRNISCFQSWLLNCVCSTGLHASSNWAFLRRCCCRSIGDDDSFNCVVMVYQNINRDPAFLYHMLGLWLCSLCWSKFSWDYKVLHSQRRSTGLLQWTIIYQISSSLLIFIFFNSNPIELTNNRFSAILVIKWQ